MAAIRKYTRNQIRWKKFALPLIGLINSKKQINITLISDFSLTLHPNYKFEIFASYSHMKILIIIFVALLPAALLWWYIWEKDQKKEPTKWLAKATWYGVLICFPVALVELMIGAVLFYPDGHPTTLLGTTACAFFQAAIPEESFKLLALWLVLRKNPYFDEHFDGIVYAVCIGLGFAAIENVGYLLDNIEDWMSVAFLRSLMAVPGHYAFAILMGYYYSKYHFVDHSRKTAALILVAPVLAHGVYDALLMTAMVNAVIGGVCFIITVILVCRLHVYAHKKVLSMIDTDNYFGGEVLNFMVPETDASESDFEIRMEEQKKDELNKE